MPDAKTCSKCRETKPLDAFYRDRTKADGVGAYCKPCRQARNKAWFDAHPGYAATKYAAWKAATPDYAERSREYASRQRVRDRGKVRARQILQKAVDSGRILRQPCEHCGATPTEGHHEDHSKPLEVIWLCRPCHIALHKARGDRMKRYE
jgi:hypothetical protein